MSNEEFMKLGLRAVALLKWFAPFDTGNLAHNAIKYKIVGNSFTIYLDEKIAPYMPYTNEPWLSPLWQGKKNPNEGWFDNAVNLIYKFVKEQTKGE